MADTLLVQFLPEKLSIDPIYMRDCLIPSNKLLLPFFQRCTSLAHINLFSSTLPPKKFGVFIDKNPKVTAKLHTKKSLLCKNSLSISDEFKSVVCISTAQKINDCSRTLFYWSILFVVARLKAIYLCMKDTRTIKLLLFYESLWEKL